MGDCFFLKTSLCSRLCRGARWASIHRNKKGKRNNSPVISGLFSDCSKSKEGGVNENKGWVVGVFEISGATARREGLGGFFSREFHCNRSESPF